MLWQTTTSFEIRKVVIRKSHPQFYGMPKGFNTYYDDRKTPDDDDVKTLNDVVKVSDDLKIWNDIRR